jgi:hypothetical protein
MRTGTLYEDLHILLIISRSVLLRMRNVSDKSCRQHQNTFYAQFFFFENLAVYEITWEKMVEPGRPQIAWRMCITCWTPAATNTHSQCIILIVVPLHQLLQERASMLLLYIHCLSCCLYKTYTRPIYYCDQLFTKE